MPRLSVAAASFASDFQSEGVGDPDRAAPRFWHSDRAVARIGGAGVRRTATRADAMIRIDAAWIVVEPFDSRSGVDTALARVVSLFGASRIFISEPPGEPSEGSGP